jgi:hypothetical protein
MRLKPKRIIKNDVITTIPVEPIQIDEIPPVESENINIIQEFNNEKFDDLIDKISDFEILVKSVFGDMCNTKKYIDNNNINQYELLKNLISDIKKDIIDSVSSDVVKNQVKNLDMLINNLLLSPDIKNLLIEIKNTVLSPDIKNLLIEIKNNQENNFDKLNLNIDTLYDIYNSQKNDISRVERLVFNVVECLEKQNLIIQKLSNEIKELKENKIQEIEEPVIPIKEKKSWFKKLF